MIKILFVCHLVKQTNTNKTKLPVVIVNSFQNESKELIKNCLDLKCEDFILAEIYDINWNDQMSPWYMDPLYKNDMPYLGKADEYLKQLVNNTIPEIKEYINTHFNISIDYYVIAGYSLAGLFALYSAYNTDVFKRVVSASGSLWYPNFLEYVYNNTISDNVDKVYLSLGNLESNTKHELMRKVKDNTLKIQDYLSNNLNVYYEENEGNHFKEPLLRMAKGIKYILQD